MNQGETRRVRIERITQICWRNIRQGERDNDQAKIDHYRWIMERMKVDAADNQELSWMSKAWNKFDNSYAEYI